MDETEKVVFREFLINRINMNSTDVDIYMELLKHPWDVKNLVRLSKKNKSTVQESLKRLEREGFVDHRLGGGPKRKYGKKYRAIQPREALENFFNDVENIWDVIEKFEQMSELQAEQVSERQLHDEIWVRENQRSAIDSIAQLIKKARSDILIYGTDFSWIHIRPEITTTIKNKIKQNCNVKIIGTFDGNRGKIAKKVFKENNIKTKTVKTKFSPFCIIDQDFLIIGHEILSGEYHCEFISNKNTIKNYVNLFNRMR